MNVSRVGGIAENESQDRHFVTFFLEPALTAIGRHRLYREVEFMGWFPTPRRLRRKSFARRMAARCLAAMPDTLRDREVLSAAEFLASLEPSVSSGLRPHLDELIEIVTAMDSDRRDPS